MKKVQIDPQFYVIKTDCSWRDDFDDIIGKFRYVSGGKNATLLAYTSEITIDEYFKENECYNQYEILHPLLKIAEIEESDNDEYIVETSVVHTNATEYENDLGNRLSDFIFDNVEEDDRRILSESSQGLNYSEIYKNIIKFNKKYARILNENDIVDNEDNTNRTKIFTNIHVSRNVFNEVISYLCVQNDISMIINKHIRKIIDDNDESDNEPRKLNTDDKFDHIKYIQSMTGNKSIIWDHSLTGNNIVIGIGDTGVDEYHCMFGEEGEPAMKYGTINSDFRKIYSYMPYCDKFDISSGHGTHVCGIAAGKCYNGHSEYNSLAYNSKIFFFDFSVDGQSIIIPTDIQNEYFDVLRRNGVYISSNSWGTNKYTATPSNQDIDEYIYEHDDFVVLFAAGNDGTKDVPTISLESQAKNVISVACSLRPNNRPTMDKYIYYNLLEQNIMYMVNHLKVLQKMEELNQILQQ